MVKVEEFERLNEIRKIADDVFEKINKLEDDKVFLPHDEVVKLQRFKQDLMVFLNISEIHKIGADKPEYYKRFQ